MRHPCRNRSDDTSFRNIYRLCLLSFALAALDSAPLATSFTTIGQRTLLQTTIPAPASALTVQKATTDSNNSNGNSNGNKAYDPEDEVQLRLARARAVLEKSKAKLEKGKERTANGTNGSATTTSKEAASVLPFFASSKTVDPQRSDKLIKNRNVKTGLVTADGEKMAAMSEQEEWQQRSLFEVFDNEIDEDGDVYSGPSQQLAERDVVASMWNLRKAMKTEDYLRIFDKKNRFIGEDN